jgi:tetratricopeptide (TPR) repeat protein
MNRLEEERDFLLESLRDLDQEHAAGDIDEADYTRLRDDYTTRAAAALRAIDAREAAGAGLPPATPARRSPRLVAAVTAGVLAVAVLAGVLVAQYSGERVEGQEVSGATPPTAPLDDLTRARQLFSERNYLDALKLYDAVLKREPDNVEALAYRGWLLFQASAEEFTDRALQSLDRAVVVDPGFPDAHFFRGWVLRYGKGDAAAAVPEFRAFLDSNPPPQFRQRVEQELNLALCDLGRAPAGITCPPDGQSPSTPSTTPGP